MADNKGDMSVREAGERGGRKTSQTHDRSHYQAIGQKGGSIGGQRVRELIDKGKQAENQ